MSHTGESAEAKQCWGMAAAFPPPHLLQEAASEGQAANARPSPSPLRSPLLARGFWPHSTEHPQPWL